ncbi:MAG: ankyrin repeat domain-containing protein [Lysobacteraceae bacterium]
MDANKNSALLHELLADFREMAMFEDCEILAPESPCPDGDTPLHVIALDGNLDLLEKILPFVTNIDVAGDCGYTPLHYAIKWRHLDVAKLLLAQGADPERIADYGDSAMTLMEGRIEFTDILRDIRRSRDA